MRTFRQLRKQLTDAGCRIVRQVGSHQVWKHPDVPSEFFVLAGKDSRPATAKIEKQLAAFLAAVAAKRKGKQP